MFEADKAIDKITLWLQEKCTEAGAKGIVFGLSGGIDSAVVAYLGKRAFGDNIMGVIMPCDSNPQDEKDAVLLAEAGGIPYKKVELDGVLKSFLSACEANDDNKMAYANIKPRLRMTTLYYHAACMGLMVAGTGNLSELTVGYFTKYGDSGVDLLPLGDLVKREVYQVAGLLNIPEAIISKAPSAGLWFDQTDEIEMGFSYQILDGYIRGEISQGDVIDKIKSMNAASEHKRNMPEICFAH